MKVLLQQKKRSPTLDYMESISTSIATMSSSRREYTICLTEFAANLVAMTRAVCPEYEQQVVAIKDIYSKISLCNNKLADAELRTSEDIKDLIERFAIVSRVNEEYLAQKEAYDQASNWLLECIADEMAEKDQPGYEKNRLKIEAAIIKAKTDKNSHNKILKVRIQNLIDQKEKYNKFKLNRLISAWKTFSEGLNAFAVSEEKLYQQLNSALDALRGVGAPAEVVEAVAEAASQRPSSEAEQAVKQQLDESVQNNQDEQ